MADRLDPILPPVPWSTKDVLGAIGVVAGTMLLAGLGTPALLSMTRPATPSGTVNLVLLWLATLEGVLLVTAWYFGVRRYNLSWVVFGFRRLTSGLALLHIGWVLAVALFTSILYALAVRALGWEAFLPAPLPTALAEDPSAYLPLAVIALFLAPVAEETFFRGFVFPGIGRRYGLLWGALASAGLFGVSHMHPGLFVPTTVLGLLLALVYVRTGSLWGPIVTHFSYNALALAATR